MREEASEVLRPYTAFINTKRYSPPQRGGVAETKAKTGWSVRRDFAGLTTPSGPSGHPPLLSEKGNNVSRSPKSFTPLNQFEIDEASLRVCGNQPDTHAVPDVQMRLMTGELSLNWWTRQTHPGSIA